MGNSDNINAPVSPQEWYEAGVLLRREERFGDAINAFRRAADLAASSLVAIEASPSSDEAVTSSDNGSRPLSAISGEGSVKELEKIRDASLAFIEMINEIREFVNKDLLNP